ncbi:MAG: phytoene desaturase [Cytophagales bacterium]|nr:MAG: phytoene desaturase [Cytophagales bacterium]
MSKKVVVIGAGFSGLSAATTLAAKGYNVKLVEKHNIAGGRARIFEAEGFRYDMGPSWYWMPDVFEQYFATFGKKVEQYYQLERLNPSYRVYFEKNNAWDIPANLNDFKDFLETKEKGSAKQLDRFLAQAAYKYQVGINDLVYKPSRSLLEFVDLRLLMALFRMDVFTSMHKHIRRFFKHPHIIQLMEFPILFLGALPQNTPALYSLMNYADIALGTWYPKGGMYEIVRGMQRLAEENGVEFFFSHEVQKIEVMGKNAKKVITSKGDFEADVVVVSADYHHAETNFLASEHRSYSEKYWDSRTMAPSSFLYYLGLNKKVPQLLHHNLFFDTDFDKHAREIYQTPKMPTDPLFYTSVPSITDPNIAPEGHENMFILIPIAPNLEDPENLREHYYNVVMERLAQHIGEDLRPHVIYKRNYSHQDFMQDYGAYKGNAYGLANTLMQTAILKPSLKSKKVNNLYYTGQLTVPGPGVPPSLISGQVVAKEIAKDFAIIP